MNVTQVGRLSNKNAKGKLLVDLQEVDWFTLDYSTCVSLVSRVQVIQIVYISDTRAPNEPLIDMIHSEISNED